MKAPSFTFLLSGFLVWSVGFLLLYGVQATGCHLGWHEVPIGPISALRLILLALLAAMLALIGALVWHATKARRTAQSENIGILADIARLLQIAALASTVLVYAGVAWLTLC
ncbi:hypothetical protein [Peteryoungia ipomoeae]|uniref:Uncharacterized protein n=1 Tax=Peteryoungia ipomoeae TaxID=1210932 RepID=A0A4S8NS70_9HYPH|nr:hypothetical protein [Peteryoungia ipomoeae]THV20207.1 hypothetical protein FAA97_19370 [Peteryoungia ipomoeae]